MGLSRLQLFSPCVLFFGSHVSLISKYTVGLHLGMRDMLRCCGLRYTCFVWAHRGSSFLFSVISFCRCFQFVSGCVKRFGLHLCIVMLIAPPQWSTPSKTDTEIGTTFEAKLDCDIIERRIRLYGFPLRVCVCRLRQHWCCFVLSVVCVRRSCDFSGMHNTTKVDSTADFKSTAAETEQFLNI